MKSLKHLKGLEIFNSGALPAHLEFRNANGSIDATTTGYQYVIQTTDQIRAKVIEQKFYKVPPAEYLPVIVGEGAWMEGLKTNAVYDVAGDFETGIISTASAPSQISKVDVALAPISTVLVKWAKGYQYDIPEVSQALAANNWDVVQSKMNALKRNWDLGTQKIAFLGLKGSTSTVPGLYTNSSVTINLTRITASISGLSAANFGTLVAGIIADYFTNSNQTELPDTFLIPMDDYLGLMTPVNPEFPLVSKLQYLEDAFKRITKNPSFKIDGIAYGTAANNAGYINGASGRQRYILYRNDQDTMFMEVPVPFNLTPAGTANNFQFDGVGFGQFSGVTILRIPEVLYFDY